MLINYLHDADDSDRCSATLLAEQISVRNGLSDVFLMVEMFAYDDVCDIISDFALSLFFILFLPAGCQEAANCRY